MRRILCALVLVAPAPALAEETDTGPPAAPDDAQVALAAELGATGGGGSTPGGLRLGGHYLYRLSSHDWFDGGVAFTFGRPGAGCGRVPPTGMRCDHAPTDGFAGDLSLGVRRDLPGQGRFVPYLRGAVFARVLRFASDDLTGVAAGGELSFGVRAAVRGELSLVGGATFAAGVAALDGIDNPSQMSLTIAGGAELRMR